MHRYDLENDSYTLRMKNYDMMAFEGKEMETTHEMLRMGEKNSHN